jgi:hypothetical protein
MKGYIYVNKGDGRYFCIIIHTKILNPFSFDVVNPDKAVYFSPKFKIKKIINIKTKKNLHHIYRFRVGKVFVGAHSQQIFKNLKALRAYHHSLCPYPPPNGNLISYSLDGSKRYLKKMKNNNETIIQNFKKNKTTIIFSNSSPPLIYPYMVFFRRNEFEYCFFDINKISASQYWHNHFRKEKTYTRDGTLAHCHTSKNGKNHLLFSDILYDPCLIYQNGKKLSKNLQSLLHSPFNFIIKTQIKIF